MRPTSADLLLIKVSRPEFVFARRMERGWGGAGAELVSELVRHATQPQFIYVHEWEEGDCVVYVRHSLALLPPLAPHPRLSHDGHRAQDNRCTWHTPTWHDAEAHERVMFRTTVRGNAGPDHSGPDSQGSMGFIEAKM